MAAKDKQAFVKGLATDHRRRRPLMVPSRRALLWYAIAFVISAVLMYFVQVFRPGFASQLLHHPFFLIEIASALLFSFGGAYLLLSHSIPGERGPKRLVVGLYTLAVLFAVGLVASFTSLAPESTTVGARHACWLEVLAYGAICLVVMIVMMRRGFVRFSWSRGMLYGLVAGLVPAALMQLACMYNPSHALVFHYLPTLVLVVLGLVLMRMIRR